MIHPHTELKFISEEVGYGIVATRFIPQGTIIWIFDKLDREFSPEEFHKMDLPYQEVLETYTFRNNKGNFVLCWDNGRFVNHSFKSNCFATAYNFEIAIKDIEAGEELTDDYGYLNIIAPFTAYDEGTVRKTVYPDDLLTYHQEWDEKIAGIFRKIPLQEQPLKTLMDNALWQEIVDVAEGRSEMKSLINNYFADKHSENKNHD